MTVIRNYGLKIITQLIKAGTARLRRDDCGVSGKENNCYTDYTTKTLSPKYCRYLWYPTKGALVAGKTIDVTKNSASIFEASAIMKTEYASYINTYPTIFLSFADAKESKRRIVKSIKEQLLNVYDEYACVLEKLSMFEKPKFDLILRGLSDLEDENLEPVDHAISFLMKKCHQYYKKRVMLFIDE